MSFSPLLFLVGGGAFPPSMRYPPSFGCAASLRLLWVARPFPFLERNEGKLKRIPFRMTVVAPSSFSGGGLPAPSAFGGVFLSLPNGGGSYSTSSSWAFAPSSPLAGGSPPPPFPVGSEPLAPFSGGPSPSPPGVVMGRVLLCWVFWVWCSVGCCVVRWFGVAWWNVGWLGGWAVGWVSIVV